MFKSLTFAAALAMGAAALTPVAADAQRYHGPRYERGDQTRPNHGYRAGPRYDRRRDSDRTYDRRRNQRCDPRADGNVIGAIAGGLLGSRGSGRGAALANNPRRCR